MLKLKIDLDSCIHDFTDDDHLSWIADTHHTMIFEILAAEYHDMIVRIQADADPRCIDEFLMRLNTAYIYALKYFGC